MRGWCVCVEGVGWMCESEHVGVYVWRNVHAMTMTMTSMQQVQDVSSTHKPTSSYTRTQCTHPKDTPNPHIPNLECVGTSDCQPPPLVNLTRKQPQRLVLHHISNGVVLIKHLVVLLGLQCCLTNGIAEEIGTQASGFCFV